MKQRNKRTGMKLTFIDSPEDISKEDLIELESQGVDLSRWNYIILAPKSACHSFIETKETIEFQADGTCTTTIVDVKAWKPYSPFLESLLRSQIKNVWYGSVTFRGIKKSIGVSYGG